jgi:hypothetical protein
MVGGCRARHIKKVVVGSEFNPVCRYSFRSFAARCAVSSFVEAGVSVPARRLSPHRALLTACEHLAMAARCLAVAARYLTSAPVIPPTRRLSSTFASALYLTLVVAPAQDTWSPHAPTVPCKMVDSAQCRTHATHVLATRSA